MLSVENPELEILQLDLARVEQTAKLGTWRWDGNGTRFTWSEGTFRIFGRTRKDFIPSPDSVALCIHPLDREGTLRAISQAFRSRAPAELDFRINPPDNSLRWVHLSLAPLVAKDGSPGGMVGTLQDVTERRRLEEQLRLCQRRELLGLLAGGIAHDFNNFLTVMRGRAEMVFDEPGISEFGRDCIHQVLDAVDRAASLSRQISAFSRCQSVQVHPCDLNKLITQLLKMLRRILGEQVQIHQELAPDLPEAQVDPAMVEQILMNLCVAAREAMPRGGDLKIASAIASPGPGSPAGGGMVVQVRVSQSGPGFMTRGAELHSEGVSADNPVGLPVVQELAQKLRATLEFEQDGAGSAVRINFPVAAGKEGATAERKPTGGLPGGTERILLVEDDPGVRGFLGVFLGRLGYRVAEVSTGPEAMRIFEEENGNFDLLLTDQVMPCGMTGLELAMHLQRQKPSLLSVGMSGYTKDSPAPTFNPQIAWVAKPFTPDVLAQAIRAHLDSHRKR